MSDPEWDTFIDECLYDFHYHNWKKKAKNNIDKWDVQDLETLLLCMTEELGELTQAYLQAEHEEFPRHNIEKESDDLAALLIQFKFILFLDKELEK